MKKIYLVASKKIHYFSKGSSALNKNKYNIFKHSTITRKKSLGSEILRRYLTGKEKG